MKRTLEERNMKCIKKYTPRFCWVRCSECSAEFKHEPMWRLKYHKFYGDGYHSYCIMFCTTCFPTFEEVYKRCIHLLKSHKRRRL